MARTAKFSGVDRDSKQGNLTIGIDAGATSPEIQALTDALDAISLATGLKSVISDIVEVDGGDATPPVSNLANRGTKFLFRTQYTQGNGDTGIALNELPIADYSVLPAGSDTIDLTTGVGLTLKTAWEAVYLSPHGTPGTLLSVQQVTRTDN